MIPFGDHFVERLQNTVFNTNQRKASSSHTNMHALPLQDKQVSIHSSPCRTWFIRHSRLELIQLLPGTENISQRIKVGTYYPAQRRPTETKINHYGNEYGTITSFDFISIGGRLKWFICTCEHIHTLSAFCIRYLHVSNHALLRKIMWSSS